MRCRPAPHGGGGQKRASSPIAPMPKKPRARPSLADRFCEAIKELTADRQTRTYAAQWIMVHSADGRLRHPSFKGFCDGIET